MGNSSVLTKNYPFFLEVRDEIMNRMENLEIEFGPILSVGNEWCGEKKDGWFDTYRWKNYVIFVEKDFCLKEQNKIEREQERWTR